MRKNESRRARPIDVDAYGRLPERIEDGQVRNAGHRLQDVADLLRRALEDFELVAEELHGILALHPGGGFLHVVLDVL